MWVIISADKKAVSAPEGRITVLDLIPSDDSHALERLALDQDVRESIEASRALATRRAYRTDWTNFQAWCGRRCSLQPSACSVYRGRI